MSFNPADYPDKSPGMSETRPSVKPGKHLVKIQSVAYDPSKQTLAVTFEDANDGATIRGWYPTEKGNPRGWITRDLCKAVRWPHTFEQSSQKSRDHVFVGQQLEIVVIEDEWQGKIRLKVKYTNRLPGVVELRPVPDQNEPEDEDDGFPF